MENNEIWIYLVRLVLAFVFGIGFVKNLSDFFKHLGIWAGAKFGGDPAEVTTAKKDFGKTWGPLAGSFVFSLLVVGLILFSPVVPWIVNGITTLVSQIQWPDMTLPPSATPTPDGLG